MLIAKAGACPGEPPGQPGPARKGTAAPSQRERRGRPARQRTAGALRRQNDRRAALGLFETAIKLEDAQDRAAMHKLALLMAESLSLDSWIAECGPSKI